MPARTDTDAFFVAGGFAAVRFVTAGSMVTVAGGVGTRVTETVVSGI